MGKDSAVFIGDRRFGISERFAQFDPATFGDELARYRRRKIVQFQIDGGGAGVWVFNPAK